VRQFGIPGKLGRASKNLDRLGAPGPPGQTTVDESMRMIRNSTRSPPGGWVAGGPTVMRRIDKLRLEQKETVGLAIIGAPSANANNGHPNILNRN
jgi:hypothetical protein